MSPTVMGFAFVAVIMFAAIWAYVETTFKKMNTTGITQMPPPPRVTPTIMVENVIVGDATYFDNSEPEVLIDVIKIVDGIVYYIKSNSNKQFTAQTELFLSFYTVNVPTKITNTH